MRDWWYDHEIDDVVGVPVASDDGRTALYRHFGKSGELLYVGISLHPIARQSQHRRSAAWYQDIVSVTFEWHATRGEAEEAERLAIQTESPLYNVVHRPKLTVVGEEGDVDDSLQAAPKYKTPRQAMYAYKQSDAKIPMSIDTTYEGGGSWRITAKTGLWQIALATHDGGTHGTTMKILYGVRDWPVRRLWVIANKGYFTPHEVTAACLGLAISNWQRDCPAGCTYECRNVKSREWGGFRTLAKLLRDVIEAHAKEYAEEELGAAA